MKKWYQNTIFIIALLILFFPVGLFLMWKYTSWNKIVKWVITGFFALALLGSIFGSKTDNSSTNTATTSTPASQTGQATSPSLAPTKAPVKPPTFTEQLWIALDKSMQTRDGYKIDYDTDSKTATITSSVSEAWDENALVRGSYTVLVKYGREVFKVNNVDAVRVVVRTKFTDQYGKDSWDDAVRIIMSKAEFNKFNWDNLNYTPVSLQIQAAADGYYVAPAVDAKTTIKELYLSI